MAKDERGSAELNLTALAGRPPRISEEHAARIAREVFAREGTPRLLYGERDQNFHITVPGGQDILLKIVDGQEDPQVIDLQLSALRHVARIDPSLPVPRLIKTRNGEYLAQVEGPQGELYAVYALSFLPGEMLEGTPAAPALLTEIGRVVARLGLALRGFFHGAAGRRIAWDPRQAASLRPHTHLIADRQAPSGCCWGAGVERVGCRGSSSSGATAGILPRGPQRSGMVPACWLATAWGGPHLWRPVPDGHTRSQIL